MYIKINIYFSSDKYDIHTDIEPQHKKHNNCKASVRIGTICKMINIVRIYIGKRKPAHRGKQRARQIAQQ